MARGRKDTWTIVAQLYYLSPHGMRMIQHQQAHSSSSSDCDSSIGGRYEHQCIWERPRIPTLIRERPRRSRANMPKQSTWPASPEIAVTAQEAITSPTTARLRRMNSARARASANTAGTTGARMPTATMLTPARTPAKQSSKPNPSAPELNPALTENSKMARPANIAVSSA
uniref:Uncharacterized protein n=1 Tax=Setaria italica TaxID=4555 RepID=K3YJX3_SETIT